MDAKVSRSLTILVAAIALLVALVGLAVTACNSDSGEATATTLTLTAEDNGGSFMVKVGDTVTVTLEGNPTTGYTWESDMREVDSPLIVMVDDEPTYTQTETDSQMTGSGGTFTFTFEAVASGQVDLRLKYWRSFEAQAEPLETFVATLTIQ